MKQSTADQDANLHLDRVANGEPGECVYMLGDGQCGLPVHQGDLCRDHHALLHDWFAATASYERAFRWYGGASRQARRWRQRTEELADAMQAVRGDGR